MRPPRGFAIVPAVYAADPTEVVHLSRSDRFAELTGSELYRRLAMGEPLVVLDVRTHEEFAHHHIPGAKPIPLHELEPRLPEVEPGEIPIAVVCEHGIRSVSACRLLAEHGFANLLNVTGGMVAWPGPTTSFERPNGAHGQGIAPSSFLVEHFELLPRGLALDLAMGDGRNAIYLATRGYDVDGVDRDPKRVSNARTAARRLGAPIRAIVGDVEDGTYILPIEAYDLIVVVNFLHRPLFRDIRDGLRPGGAVVYQTYTREQAQYGKPSCPDYLLDPGELAKVFADWEILKEREFTGPRRGSGEPSAIASIIARKPLD